MYKIVYNTTTGKIVQSKNFSDSAWDRFLLNNPGTAGIPGYLTVDQMPSKQVDVLTQQLIDIQLPTVTDEEYIRQRRNLLLANSDWTQAVDAPLSTEQKQLWQDYRLVLRNIPQDYDLNTVSRDAIVWPTKP